MFFTRTLHIHAYLNGIGLFWLKSVKQKLPCQSKFFSIEGRITIVAGPNLCSFHLILLNLIVDKAANVPLKAAKLPAAGSLTIVLNFKEANLDRRKYYFGFVNVEQFVKQCACWYSK